MIKTFSKGNIIVKQGDNENKNLYIVKSGRCTIQRAVSNTVIDCGKIYPGDIFGELSMILGLSRSASIIALDENVEVEELNKKNFLDLMQQNPEIAWTLLTKLAIKTQTLDEIQGQINDPQLIKTLLKNTK